MTKNVRHHLCTYDHGVTLGHLPVPQSVLEITIAIYALYSVVSRLNKAVNGGNDVEKYTGGVVRQTTH